MSDFQSTEFKKLQTDASIQTNLFKKADEQETKQFFDFDTVKKNREDNMAKNMGTIFSQRYEAKIPKQSAILKQTQSTYKELFGRDYSGVNAEDKRTKHATRQINVQRHLKKEADTLNQYREDQQKVLTESLSQKELDALSDTYEEEEEKEALRQWAVVHDHEGKQRSFFKGLTSGNKLKKADALNEILNIVKETVDPATFTFNSNKDFVKNYAKKYEILSRGAAAEVFLKELEGLIEDGSVQNTSLYEAKAAIEFCKVLKVEYEERMSMISSPYYALLTKGDLERFLDRNGEVNTQKLGNALNKDITNEKSQEFFTYLKRYGKLLHSTTGKKSNLASLYRQKLTAAQEHYRDKDVQKIRDLHLEEGEDDVVLQNVFDSAKETKTHFHQGQNDAGYLRDVPVDLANGQIEYFTEENTQKFETMLASILEDGKFLNDKQEEQTVKAEDLEEIRALITELSQAKREYNQYSAGSKLAEGLKGNYVDLTNPSFLKTAEGKKALQLKQGDKWKSTKKTLQQKCADYFKKLETTMLALNRKGYSVFPQYMDILNNQEQIEKGLRKTKAEYDKTYEKRNPLQKGEVKKKINFPEAKINGKSYSTYGMGGLLDKIAGKDLELKGQNAKEIENLLSEYSTLLRYKAGVDGFLSDEEDLKPFMRKFYEGEFKKRQQDLDEKLLPLLQAEFPKYFLTQGYLDQFDKDYKADFSLIEKDAQPWIEELRQDNSGKYISSFRRAAELSNFIAFSEKDQEQKSDYHETFKTFSLVCDGTKLNKEEKKAKILLMKKTFKAIMDFDLSTLSVNDPKELLSEEKRSKLVFLRFFVDSQVFFSDFANLMQDPEAKAMMDEKDADTSLTDEQFMEVCARGEFLSVASSVYHNMIKLYVEAGKAGLDPDEVWKLSQNELDEKMSKEPDKMLIYMNAKLAKNDFGKGYFLNDVPKSMEIQKKKRVKLDEEKTQEQLSHMHLPNDYKEFKKAHKNVSEEDFKILRNCQLLNQFMEEPEYKNSTQSLLGKKGLTFARTEDSIRRELNLGIRTVRYKSDGQTFTITDARRLKQNKDWIEAFSANDEEHKQKQEELTKLAIEELGEELNAFRFPSPQELQEGWIRKTLINGPQKLLSLMRRLDGINERKSGTDSVAAKYIEKHPEFSERRRLMDQLRVAVTQYLGSINLSMKDVENKSKAEKDAHLKKMGDSVQKYEKVYSSFAKNEKDREAKELRDEKRKQMAEDYKDDQAFQDFSENFGSFVAQKDKTLYGTETRSAEELFEEKKSFEKELAKLTDKKLSQEQMDHLYRMMYLCDQDRTVLSQAKVTDPFTNIGLLSVRYDLNGKCLTKEDEAKAKLNAEWLRSVKSGDKAEIRRYLRSFVLPDLDVKLQRFSFPEQAQATDEWLEEFLNENAEQQEETIELMRRCLNMDGFLENEDMDTDGILEEYEETHPEFAVKRKAMERLTEKLRSLYLRDYGFDPFDSACTKRINGQLLPVKSEKKADQKDEEEYANLQEEAEKQEEKRIIEEQKYIKDIDQEAAGWKKANKDLKIKSGAEQLAEFKELQKKNPLLTLDGWRYVQKHMQAKAVLKHPEYSRLANEIRKKPGKKLDNNDATLSRGLSYGIVPVRFDDNGVPVSEEDQKNHERNLRWLNAFLNDDEQTKQEIFTEELDKLDKIEIPDLEDIGDLSQINDPEVMSGQKPVVLGKWYKEMEKQPELAEYLASRLLTYANLKGVGLEKAAEDYAKTHPNFRKLIKGLGMGLMQNINFNDNMRIGYNTDKDGITEPLTKGQWMGVHMNQVTALMKVQTSYDEWQKENEKEVEKDAQELEKRLNDEAYMKKALDAQLLTFSEEMFKLNPPKDGKMKKRKKFPYTTINGQKISTYATKGSLLNVFELKELELSGKNIQEAQKILAQCSEILKKKAMIEGLLRLNEAVSRDAAKLLLKRCDQELQKLEIPAINLLYKADKGVIDYVNSKPELMNNKEIEFVKERIEKEEEKKANVPIRMPEMKVLTKKERSRIAKSWKDPFSTVRTSQLSHLSKHVTKDLNECSNADFALLSSVMTENEQQNKKLIELYLGKKGAKKDEDQPRILDAMDMITENILSIKTSGFDLSDEGIAKSPQSLERMCLNLSGYKIFLERFPEYLIGKDEETTEKIRTKVDQLSTIATYYQTRKGIISNPLYATLDVKKMTLDPTALRDEEERSFAIKLLESEVMAKRMLEKNNVDQEIIDARKLPEFKDQEEAEDLIAELEEYQDELIGEFYLKNTDKKEVEKFRKLALEPPQEKKEEKKKEEKKKEEKKKEEKKKAEKKPVVTDKKQTTTKSTTAKSATTKNKNTKLILNWDLDDTVDHDELLKEKAIPLAQMEEMTHEEYEEMMNFENRVCNAKDFPIEEKRKQEKVLADLGYPGAARTKVVFDIFKQRLVYEGYLVKKRFVKENGMTSSDEVWTEEAKKKPQLIKAFNFLQDYYKAHDMGRPKPGGPKPLDKQQYPTTYQMVTISDQELLGMQMKYEHQDTNNCWACSGTAILNHYLMKNNKKPKLVDQYDMRGYKPKYKEFKDVKETLGNDIMYNAAVNETKTYIGRGKTGVGNVFEVGDFILDRAPNAMLHRLMLQVAAPYDSKKITEDEKREKDTIYDNQKRIFMKQVHSCIQAGHPVSILSKSICKGFRHYVTIVGIGYDEEKKTDVIKYLDSLETKENKGKGPMPIKSMPVDEVMSKMGNGQQIELTWLTDMEKDADLKKKFTNLKTNPKGEYYEEEKTMEASMNVMNTKGVTVSQYPNEMPDGHENVMYTVYMPKKSTVKK